MMRRANRTGNTAALRMSALAAALAAALTATPASALNIVIANDDGLTSNVKALYEALVAAGHQVIVSVPCGPQSGMGAALKFGALPPLAGDCLNGAARAGARAAGTMTRAGLTDDYHYVAGTPVMATLYGVDVLARARWGKAPDLILSGPNEGQNVGRMIISSGTVSNAQYGAMRGIPSIAVSADVDTTDNDGLANPRSATVARAVAGFVARLEAAVGRGAPLLPKGLALNVNFPKALEGAHWKFAEIGDYDAYDIRFIDTLSTRPQPAPATPPGPLTSVPPAHAPTDPGIAITMNDATPTQAQEDDETVVYRGAIAVSVMRIGYQDAEDAATDAAAQAAAAADKATRAAWRERLRRVLAE